MANILIIGDPKSPLEQTRGLVGQRSGHQIYWFSVPRANLPEVDSYTIPRAFQNSSILSAFVKPIFLWSVLRKIKPDIVHVHFAQIGLMVFPLLFFRPVVVSVMGGDILPDQGYRGIPSILTRILLDHADCITSKSKYMDEALRRIGDYQDKIQRITWGISMDTFHPNRDSKVLRDRFSIPPDDIVVFDPRLAKPFYNKHIILDAFAKFLNSVDNSATLLVAELYGDPPYLVQLHNQATKLGINNKVRFLGAIPYNQMPVYYSLADVTITIPPSDGLPQTIFEAFSCGSFLILGDLPQYAGVVKDKVTACLIPVGDVQELSEALSWAVNNPAIRQRAKKIGYDIVRKIGDLDKQAVLVNQIYKNLLKK